MQKKSKKGQMQKNSKKGEQPAQEKPGEACWWRRQAWRRRDRRGRRGSAGSKKTMKRFFIFAALFTLIVCRSYLKLSCTAAPLKGCKLRL